MESLLPSELTEEQDFEILEFSYVLFIQYLNNLYCVIGGSGMNVIKNLFIHLLVLKFIRELPKLQQITLWNSIQEVLQIIFHQKRNI